MYNANVGPVLLNWIGKYVISETSMHRVHYHNIQHLNILL